MPSAAHIFEVGVGALPSAFLDKLVREHIERAMEDLDLNSPPPPAPSSSDLLLNDMGHYFSRTAMMWAYLTENLLKGPHLEQALLKAHDRSRTDSGMSDLSEVARIDVDIARLQYV